MEQNTNKNINKTMVESTKQAIKEQFPALLALGLVLTSEHYIKLIK